jgi:uroporphyrinogen-III synthase
MPALPKIAAVGKATAQALENAAWRVNCVPATEFSSEGLLAEAALQTVSDKNCFIVRGVGGRDKLEQGLRSRGAYVAYLEVYRRQQPKIDNSDLVKRIAEQQLDAITITSIEALQNLLAMLDSASAKQIETVLLVAASQRIAEAAEQLGFTQIAVSQQPTDLAILETLTTLFNGENSGRRN